MSRNPRKFIPPQKIDVRKSEFSTNTQARLSHDPAISFSKAKAYVFVWAKKILNIENPSSMGPGSTIQGPVTRRHGSRIQKPKCLRPRLQANTSRIYCAGLKTNQNYCSAPHIFSQQGHLKTWESCRECALPRQPVLDSKTNREVHALVYIALKIN